MKGYSMETTIQLARLFNQPIAFIIKICENRLAIQDIDTYELTNIDSLTKSYIHREGNKYSVADLAGWFDKHTKRDVK